MYQEVGMGEGVLSAHASPQRTHSSFPPRLPPLSQEVTKGALDRPSREHSRAVLTFSEVKVLKELQSVQGGGGGGGTVTSPLVDF